VKALFLASFARDLKKVRDAAVRDKLRSTILRVEEAAPEELENGRLLRGQDCARDHSAALLPNRSDGRCLMHIQRDILQSALHESRSLVGSIAVPRRLYGSTKGRALNMR
jgi:hypothetical protein